MEDLQAQLNCDEKLDVGYSKKNLLRAHCGCHGFGVPSLAVLEDAVDPNIANVDVWGRASYGELIEEEE